MAQLIGPYGGVPPGVLRATNGPEPEMRVIGMVGQPDPNVVLDGQGTETSEARIVGLVRQRGPSGVLDASTPDVTTITTSKQKCGPGGCACRPTLNSDGSCADESPSTTVAPEVPSITVAPEGEDDVFLSPDEDEDSSTGGKPMCCPTLHYPLRLKLNRVKSGPPTRLPQYGRTFGKKYEHCARVSFTFSWEGEFSNSPTPCLCSCCEFRQYLIKSEVTLDRQGKGKDAESWDGTYADPGAGQEDCQWTYQIHEPGNPKGLVKGGKYPRFGGPDKEPGPYDGPPPSVLVDGPRCKGRRAQGEDGVPADPGYPADDDCKYTGSDSPGVVIPPMCKFTWVWQARAFILDTCAGGEHEERWIDVTVTGETNSQGRVKNLRLTQTVTQYASRPT